MNKIADVLPGETVKVGIWRDGVILELDVSLAERPEDPRDAAVEGVEILGIRVDELTEDFRSSLELGPGVAGVIVRDVEPDSPGYDAGLQRNDVITEAARQPVTSPQQFAEFIEASDPGKKVLLRVQRPGRPMPLVVVLPMPEE
jgi:serine protease Do